MNTSSFDYNLPEEAIAKFPPKVRGSSKLILLDQLSGTVSHSHYANLVDHLQPGDLLVLNDTKVIKARVIAHKATRTEVELLFLESHSNEDLLHHKFWSFHSKKLKPGTILLIDDFELKVKQVDGSKILISSPLSKVDLIERYGTVPIPPYLKRKAELVDQKRYQTVFAKIPGSVAAPTASLNFTKELEQKILEKGIKIVYVTLHVGSGTFAPIRSDDLTQHTMHEEYFEIPKETVKVIQTAKKTGNAVVALGTTVTRTLEANAEKIMNNSFQETLSGEADIFIYPGYNFKIVDALLTNFHAPKSTVLMMAAAFAGKDKLLNAYKEALKNNYKFLSYGDSMLII